MTEAIHALVRRGLIRSERGHLTMLDRDGLVERAGPYYGVPESEYERLIPEAKSALRFG